LIFCKIIVFLRIIFNPGKQGLFLDPERATGVYSTYFIGV